MKQEFSITEKKCPVCNKVKSLDFYSTYFSKERQKYRIQNYFKDCQKVKALIRSQQYYIDNRDAKLEYAAKYRNENKQVINASRKKFEVRYRSELQNCYVRELLITKSKVQKGLTYENPEILETKRLSLKIKRKIKSLKKPKPLK